MKAASALSDASGSMTIPGLVFFTIAMAISGLTIDMQRVYGVHGAMQAFVDDVALAAAVELDGAASAMTRAYRAVLGDQVGGPLVAGPANSARFATDTTLTVRKITFLSLLGADPGPLAPTPAAGDVVLCTYDSGTWTPSGCNMDSALAQDARFVEIVAAPRTVSYLVLPIANVFSTAFGSGQLQATLQLRATAGFKRSICNNVPLMVCNPAEITNGVGADFQYTPGQQYRAKLDSTDWSPPNFGILANYPIVGGNVDDAIRLAFARVNPGTTCTEDIISPEDGEHNGPVRQGLNVRFDWYTGELLKSKNTDPNFAPAPNVVKGMRPEPGGGPNLARACNPKPSSGPNAITPAVAPTMPFPRDDCFMAGHTGCTQYNGVDRMGDGRWARQQYWEMNHPGAMMPDGYIDASSPIGGWTRYQTYRYEIEHPEEVDRTDGDTLVEATDGERGRPLCSTSSTDTHRDRDRRLLYMAVVNCIENAAAIGHGPVPVKAYAKVFLTEPVPPDAATPVENDPNPSHVWTGMTKTTASGTITWGTVTDTDAMFEIVDIVRANDESGLLHVYPILYR